MIVSIALNPSIDKLAVVDRVISGEIHRPRSVIAVAGGKGLNAARSAKALGAEVIAVGIFGGCAGQWVVDSLEEEGVEVSAAWCSAETRSSLSVYSIQDGTLTEFYEPGPPVTAEEWEHFRTVVKRAVVHAGWVTLSGSLPRGVPVSAIGELIAGCREAGAKVAVDLRGEALVAAFGQRPDLVKVNLAEATEALGRTAGSEPDGWPEIAGMARALRMNADSDAAVVTCGSRGAVMCYGEELWMGTTDAVGPYPVGSGDAFLGAMVFEIDRTGDPVEGFRLGMAAGAANAESVGAGRFDLDAVCRMVPDVTRLSR